MKQSSYIETVLRDSVNLAVPSTSPLQLDFLTLAPNHLEARAGAERARRIFGQLGAKPFLERLEAALSSPSER
jgi:hypothetical protein